MCVLVPIRQFSNMQMMTLIGAKVYVFVQHCVDKIRVSVVVNVAAV